MKKTILSIFFLVAFLVSAGAASLPAVKELDYAKLNSLAFTQKGRAWMAITTGGDNLKSRVLLLNSDAPMKDWTPVYMVDRQSAGYSAHNAVLWTAPDGALWLFYSLNKGYFDGCGKMMCTVCTDADGVASAWSEPVEIGCGICSAAPVVLKDGSWVLPCALWGRWLIGDSYDYFGNYVTRKDPGTYTELDGKRGAFVRISTDNGANWTESEVVNVPEYVKARYNDPQLFLDGDKLRMVIRSAGYGKHYTCSSVDGGHSWSKPHTFICAPDQPMALLKLKSGNLLMVRSTRYDHFSFIDGDGMFAYLSDDNGKSWWGGVNFGLTPDLSNPVAAQASDSRIYIAFNSDIDNKCNVMIANLSESECDAAVENYALSSRSVKVAFTPGMASARAKADVACMYGKKNDWASVALRVGTYNIQYPIKVPNWKTERLDAVVKLIEEYKFDVFGSQEPFLPQIEDMMERIGGEYDWIGPCISGNQSSRDAHFDPIFFRKDRVEVLEWDTVWYTQQPGLQGYGAYSSRLMVWARMRDKQTGKEFYCFNSHFDHIGIEARNVASEILVKSVRDIARGMPAFLTGDFNSDENTVAYRTILASGYLNDSMLAVGNPVNSQYFSMSNYKPMSTVAQNGLHIDHVFYTPNSSKVKSWQLITSSYDGKFGSDHLPILIEWYIAN